MSMDNATEIIKEHAVRDMEDMIYDITGAPVEELLMLGVKKEEMLAAANDMLRMMRGEG